MKKVALVKVDGKFEMVKAEEKVLELLGGKIAVLDSEKASLVFIEGYHACEKEHGIYVEPTKPNPFMDVKDDENQPPQQ